MSLFSLAVDVFTRTSLMIALVVATTIFNGLPTINLLILEIFLSSIVPLPTTPAISAIEVVAPRFSVIIRLFLNVSLWLLTLLLHPFMVVLNFLFYSLLDEGFHIVVYNLRNASRSLSSSLIGYGFTLFYVQFQLMVYFLRVVSSSYAWIGVITTAIRRLIKLILTFSLVFLVCPGPVAVGNYIVTGHLYPGSVIRFKCWLAQEPDPFFKYSSFLDNCFSSWTALRTTHFFIMTQALAYTSWTPTTQLVKLKQSFNSWLMVAMVISGGLCLVLSSNSYFISQVLHIIVAVGSLALFVLVLDGYHQSHYILSVYGLGTLLVITQDALVVAYEVFSTISAINSISPILIVTSCLTLWICWSVSINVCGRIVRKMANPRKSIL